MPTGGLQPPFENANVVVGRERFRWIFEADLGIGEEELLVDVGMRL